MLSGYISQGMYVWGEAMSPSLCIENAAVDCRTNASWFENNTQLSAAETAASVATVLTHPNASVSALYLTPAMWPLLSTGKWVNGLDADVCDLSSSLAMSLWPIYVPSGSACWGNLTWARLMPNTP